MKQWTESEWGALFPTIQGQYLGIDLLYHPCEFRFYGSGSAVVQGGQSVPVGYPQIYGRMCTNYRAYDLETNLPIQANYANGDAIYETKFIMNFDFTVKKCTHLSIGFFGYTYPYNEINAYAASQLAAYGTGVDSANCWLFDANKFIDTTPSSVDNSKPVTFGWGIANSGIGGLNEIETDSQKSYHFKNLNIAIVGSNNASDGSFFGIILPITNDDAEIEMGDSDVPEFNAGDDVQQDGGAGVFTEASDNRGDGTAVAVSYEIAIRSSAFDTAVNSGGFNVYQILASDMPEIMDILFGSGYFSRFANTMYNPLSAIISYHLLPSSLCTATAVSKNLKCGGYDVSTQMTTPKQYPIMSPLTTYHVGNVSLIRYFDAFPDFAPYTKLKLHLPYVGEIELDPNKCMYGELAVDYVCDVVSGNVAAWIWCKDKDGDSTWIATATGNAAYSLPMFSQQQDGGAIGKLTGGIAQLAIGAASGNVLTAAGGIGGIVSGAVTAASHQTVISGSFGGNAGILCDTVCWLEITRPQWVQTPNYQPQHGIPSYIGASIGELDLTGFVRCERIELDQIPCTDPEKDEIMQILSQGIYIKTVEET